MKKYDYKTDVEEIEEAQTNFTNPFIKKYSKNIKNVNMHKFTSRTVYEVTWNDSKIPVKVLNDASKSKGFNGVQSINNRMVVVFELLQ